MRNISQKAALLLPALLLPALILPALLVTSMVVSSCTSNEASHNDNTGRMATAGVLAQQGEQPIEVLKKYHKALVAGDSVKARELATGTARWILEYRFYTSEKDDDLRFTYGPQNIVRDTCYIPVQVKNPNDRDPAQEGKAVLVKVDSEWKVDRIAMNK